MFDECTEIRIVIGHVVVTSISTNRNCRRYHVRFKLYDNKQHIIKWEASGFDSSIYCSCSTFDLLAEQVVGISSMFAPNPFEIWLTKGEAFDWDEIEPKVVEILNQLTPTPKDR